jgi:acylphosphatase
MSTIRLTVNKETEDVLSYLETQYKPLSRAEILKLGLSNLYHNTMNMDVEILDNETSKSVEEGIKEIKEGKGKVFSSVEELMKDLNDDDCDLPVVQNTKIQKKISKTSKK